MKQGWRSPALVCAAFLAIHLVSCGGAAPAGENGPDMVDSTVDVDTSGADSPGERRDAETDPAGEVARMPNPADVHCVAVGHRLEFVREDGVPVSSLCINDSNGAKCEAWAYFRGECALDADTRPGKDESNRRS